MFFSIRDLEQRKIHFDVDIPPGEIEFNEQGLKQVSPLHTEGSAELLNNTLGEIRIRGKLKVTMQVECDRCLEAMNTELANDFDLFYRPVPETDIAHQEIALDEGESEIGFYEKDGIELEEILREHVLLLLPMQKVCNDLCRGICPVCGANRNQTDCHCEVKPVDHRWAALQDLRSGLSSKN